MVEEDSSHFFPGSGWCVWQNIVMAGVCPHLMVDQETERIKQTRARATPHHSDILPLARHYLLKFLEGPHIIPPARH